MRKRLLAPLAGLALSAALVAGCGPGPGTAATVDGRVIGEDAVASVVEDLTAYGLTVTPSQALGSLVTAPTMVEVGAEAGYGVSDQDAASALDTAATQAGLDVATLEDVGEPALLVVRSILVQNGLSGDPDGAALAEDYNARVAALDVSLNPRYGTWEAPGTLVDPSYDWLVVPAPEQA